MAREHAGSATLVLGTDPDADRLGAAVRHQGAWVHLTGNQLAVLLVDELLQRSWDKTPLVIRTEVTTSMVSRVAERAGAAVVDDLLVGFKYIGHVLEILETTGRWGAIEANDVVFAVGVEESYLPSGRQPLAVVSFDGGPSATSRQAAGADQLFVSD